MKLDRRTVLGATAAAFAAPLLAATPSRADAKRQSLVDQSLASARKVITGKDYPDAAKNMTKARGVLIVPELVQGGFILGAAGGRGTLLARSSPNNWSYPAFYGMGSGSLGLQVGAKVSEIVFIILTDKGLAAILDHKFKFGAEAGVTMVAVGIGVEGGSTAAGGADIVAFSNSAGLFAGASLEGSYLDADNDWNALYYGQGATGRAIVTERRFTNPGAEPLRNSSPSGELESELPALHALHSAPVHAELRCRNMAEGGTRPGTLSASGSGVVERRCVRRRTRRIRRRQRNSAGRHQTWLKVIGCQARRQAANEDSIGREVGQHAPDRGSRRLCRSPSEATHLKRPSGPESIESLALVLALTSSTVTPSASSIRVTPPSPFLSTLKTPSSEITMSTTRRPVSGRVHSVRSFDAPSLETCSMVTMTLPHAGHEIHRAAHALHHLARDHPVGEVAVLGHFHGAQDGQVDVAAADHGEAVGRAEIGRALDLGHGLLAGIDDVGVDLVVEREGADAQHAVLALQGDVDILRHVVRHQRRNADAEIDVVAVLQFLGGARRHLIAGPGHRCSPQALRMVRCSIFLS